MVLKPGGLGFLLPAAACICAAGLRCAAGAPIAGVEAPAVAGALASIAVTPQLLGGVLAGLLALAGLVWGIRGRRRAERRLAESEARFRAVFDNSPLSMVLKGLDGRFQLVNRAWEQRHGASNGGARGLQVEEVVDASTARRMRDQDDAVVRSRQAVQTEYWRRTRDGTVRLLTVSYPVLDDTGVLIGLGSATLDVTERTRARAALARSESRYQDLYDNAPDLYFTLDACNDIVSVNRFGAQYLGLEREQLEGLAFIELVHPADRLKVTEMVQRMFRGNEAEQERKAEFRVLDARGQTLWVHMRARHVREAGTPGCGELRVICRDITEAHKLSEELAYQASHDGLTGLVNRREFERRLGRALKGLRGDGGCHALCYLDLDRFKIVNDSCGHIAGDELLRQVAGLLLGEVRSRDVVARLGGDEFAIFMERCALDDARRIARGVLKALEQLRFTWNEQVFVVGASIGLVPVSAAMGSGEEALGAADAACSLAKEQGRGQIHVYASDRAPLARHQGEIRWLSRINQALERDEFQLWYQPIQAVSAPVSAGPRHVELLLRLVSEHHPPLLPGAFLASAERFNLAGRVDRWVVSRALDYLARCPGLLGNEGVCFVNLSGQSVSEESFLDYVLGCFASSGVDPRRLCFELTETAVISNLTRARALMDGLRELGCAFALDDFGSGVSSFAHLKRLPVDYLKIDGGFVRDMVEDPVDAAMVRSIHEMAHVMGKITIAEFVEGAATLDALTRLGVDFVQGHHIGIPRPLPAGAAVPEPATKLVH